MDGPNGWRKRRRGWLRHARRFTGLLREETRDLLGGLCGAENKALHFRASQCGHRIQLLLRLDALRGGRHVQAARNVSDGLNDREGILVVRKIADEGAINLDLVEGKASEIAQRRVAGAEIVHRNAHAELA